MPGWIPQWMTGIAMVDVVAVFGLAGIVLGVVRKVWPMVRRVDQLLDDFLGTSSRPGVDARQGVMERISDQGRKLDHVQTSLDTLAVRMDESEADLKTIHQIIDKELS